jgi:hypothetical protein
MAVGVILWRQWPLLRDVFGEAGYVGGMILTAFIWPFMSRVFLLADMAATTRIAP